MFKIECYDQGSFGPIITKYYIFKIIIGILLFELLRFTSLNHRVIEIEEADDY